jgi:uncharacterized protein DUF6230
MRGRRRRGQTSWRRFAALFLPAFSLVALLMGLLATGVVAVPLSFAGYAVSIRAAQLTVPASTDAGVAFRQFGSHDPEARGGRVPVIVTEVQHATIRGLVQTVCVPTGMPGPLADLRMTITADTATTDDLSLDLRELDGDASFEAMTVGVPLDNPRDGGTSFGDTADAVTITSLLQTAMGGSARSFVLRGMQLGVGLVSGCD